MTTVADPWAEPVGADDEFALPDDSAVVQRQGDITGGRYRFPNRDGSHKPYGWQRVTNLVSAYSDQFALRMWEIEQVMRGLAVSDETLAEIRAAIPAWDKLDKQARKDEVEKLTERCKAITGADAGAKFGNHRHDAVEHLHVEGLPPAYAGRFGRRHLALYSAALVRNELRAVPGMQERRVLVEQLEAVGTLDNVLECLRDGLFRIGDLKTQKRFWTWLEISAQFACYAHAVAVWEPDGAGGGRWVDWPVPIAQDLAYVLWMPREHPSGEPAVDVYEVDIVAGWETAKRAYEVVKDRSAAKRKREPRGWLRPAPPATVHEKWAARFAAIETKAEGSALVAEAREAGVWDTVLADCARAALARIEALKNPFGDGLTVTQN